MNDQNVGSSITNHWSEAEQIELDIEESTIYRGQEESGYNHHAQITSLDGRLYATWSNGRKHEDNVGQRKLLAISKDGGNTWGEPITVATPDDAVQIDDPSRSVVTSMGIHPHDGLLVAYYGVYEYTDAGLDGGKRQSVGKAAAAERGETWHKNTHTEARVSEDGGETWGDPQIIVDRFVPNHKPRPIGGGRLILPGNMQFAYTDDPAGIEGWQKSGIPHLPDDYVDDSEGFHKGAKHREQIVDDDTHYCEGSFYQTEDSVIHMMLRTDRNRLAVTESEDGGETWSEPMMTDYTDCQSRHQFGRLPSGSYYGLSTPKPGSARTPMILATSGDGRIFDNHYVLGNEEYEGPRIEGNHKGGLYGYPTEHIVDETMYVIYSRNKEDIAMRQLNLDKLQ